jgi:hypothetical protein
MNEFLRLVILFFIASKYLSTQLSGDTNGGLVVPFKISKMISESTTERIFVTFAAKIAVKSNSQLNTAINDGIKTGYFRETPKISNRDFLL